MAPVRPRIGVSDLRVQGEPTNRIRASANRATMSGTPASVRRGQRDPEVLHQPQGRRVDHRGRLPDGNPVELPRRGAALGVGRGHAVSHEERAGREVHDVPEDVLVGSGEIEALIAVQVLGVEHAVAVGAPRAQVAPGKDGHRVGQGAAAQRQLLDGAQPRFRDAVRSIPENADVVGRGVEDADVGALGVEPSQRPPAADR